MTARVDVACTNCGRAYPARGLPYCCPRCGGLYDFSAPLVFDPARVDPSQPGIWRYRHAFGLPPDLEPVSLGEGGTPLVWTRAFGREIAFKCEYINPSGSFKDRGSALIAAWMLARRARAVVEDSSGNAGASLAAYAARAGVRARIYLPEAASGPKRSQIKACGADVVAVPGSRLQAAEAVRRAAEEGAIYASHAYLPFNLPGYATTAFEVFEQLGGRFPGAVVAPAGQGGLLLGLGRGFDALRVASNSEAKVNLVGVQARACAPLWALFTAGAEGLAFVAENPTLAEGVRVRHPLRGDAVAAAVAASDGTFAAVDEGEILPGREALARLGFYVEPTSALIWPALAQALPGLPDPVVVILTGSGYKWQEDSSR